MSKQSNQRYRKDVEKKYNLSNHSNHILKDQLDQVEFDDCSNNSSSHKNYQDEFGD